MATAAPPRVLLGMEEIKISTPPDECPVSSVTSQEEPPVIPIPDSLVDVLKQPEAAKCEPCTEEGKVVQATWICTHNGRLMCKPCKKYYNKKQKDHVYRKLDELTAGDIKELAVLKTLHHCSIHHYNELDYPCASCEKLLAVARNPTGKMINDDETVFAVDSEIVNNHKETHVDQICKEAEAVGSTKNAEVVLNHKDTKAVQGHNDTALVQAPEDVKVVQIHEDVEVVSDQNDVNVAKSHKADEALPIYKQALQDNNNEPLVQRYATCIKEIQEGKDKKDKDVDECIHIIEQRYQEMEAVLFKYKEVLIRQAEENRDEHHVRADAEAAKLEEKLQQIQTNLNKAKHNDGLETYIDNLHGSTHTIGQNGYVQDQEPTSFVHDTRLVLDFHRHTKELQEFFGHLKARDQTLKETFVGEFPINGPDVPTGLALTDKGHILITGWSGEGSRTVDRYTSDGILVSQMNVADRGIATFDLASHQEHTYVSDFKTGNIHVYDMDDRFLKTIDTGIGRTNFIGLKVYKDDLYVTSCKKKCIHKITLYEPHQNTFVVKNMEYSPLFLDTDGEFLVVSLLGSAIYVLVCDMEGTILHKVGLGDMKLSLLYDILITPEKEIVMADSANKRLVVTTIAGMLFKTIELDGKPTALAWDTAGNVLVTTFSPNKVLKLHDL